VTTYESKAIERLPEGKGYFYADAAYDSRRVLNIVVDRGYLPCVKPRKNRARGYGARIRDRIFDKDKYMRRGICEGFFGAITNWFGDEIPCSLMETAVTRLLVRVACYTLRILLRVRIMEVYIKHTPNQMRFNNLANEY